MEESENKGKSIKNKSVQILYNFVIIQKYHIKKWAVCLQ